MKHRRKPREAGISINDNRNGKSFAFERLDAYCLAIEFLLIAEALTRRLLRTKGQLGDQLARASEVLRIAGERRQNWQSPWIVAGQHSYPGSVSPPMEQATLLRAMALLAWAFMGVGACSLDLSIPTESKISCTPSGQCPEGRECHVESNECLLPMRDLLIRLATKGLFRAKWTDEILDERFASILRQRPDLTGERLRRTRRLMTRAVRDCMVTGHEKLIELIELPDPKDRHVVAAAVRASAQVIVTQNLRDFPAKVLKEFDIEAQHPGEFVVNIIDLDHAAVCQVLEEQTAALKNPPKTIGEILDTLEAQGMAQTATILRPLLLR